MISHLNYLHEKIFELKQLEINNLSEPTLFEYYSAIFLTNHYSQSFYLWKDLSPHKNKILIFLSGTKVLIYQIALLLYLVSQNTILKTLL